MESTGRPCTGLPLKIPWTFVPSSPLLAANGVPLPLSLPLPLPLPRKERKGGKERRKEPAWQGSKCWKWETMKERPRQIVPRQRDTRPSPKPSNSNGVAFVPLFPLSSPRRYQSLSFFLSSHYYYLPLFLVCLSLRISRVRPLLHPSLLTTRKGQRGTLPIPIILPALRDHPLRGNAIPAMVGSIDGVGRGSGAPHEGHGMGQQESYPCSCWSPLWLSLWHGLVFCLHEPTLTS